MLTLSKIELIPRNVGDAVDAHRIVDIKARHDEWAVRVLPMP